MRTFHPERQRGAVLVVALIALIAMMLSGIALMRSVDTANAIAGNFAFKESTLHLTDVGVEAAAAALPGIVAGTGTALMPNQYYPVEQPTDAQGLPATVDWTKVPSTTTATQETVQYVVERMCDPVQAASGVAASPVGPVQTDRGNVTDYCVTVPQCTAATSINTPPICVTGDIYYRVTSRVTDARKTVRVVQALVSM